MLQGVDELVCGLRSVVCAADIDTHIGYTGYGG
jgi:hypothetical protein